MLYHLVPLCTTGLDALQHGHARGWMFFRGKAGFLRPLTIHLRAVRDYRKLLVAGPSLTSTQGAARGPYCVRLHRFRERSQPQNVACLPNFAGFNGPCVWYSCAVVRLVESMTFCRI